MLFLASGRKKFEKGVEWSFILGDREDVRTRFKEEIKFQFLGCQ